MKKLGSQLKSFLRGFPSSRLLQAAMYFALFSNVFVLNVAAQQSQPVSGELTWNNGETVAGNWIGSTNENVLWSVPKLFDQPLVVPHKNVKQISVSKTPKFGNQSKKANGRFRVSLIDGSVLIGEILRLDDKVLEMASDRFENLQIKRSHLKSIVNLDAKFSVHNWLNLDNWDTEKNKRQHWQVGELGRLETSGSTYLFCPLDPKYSARIEITFSWKTPDFAFGLAAPKRRSTHSIPKLESWGEELMYTFAHEFKELQFKLDQKTRQLHLSVFYDHANKRVRVREKGRRTLIDLKIEEGNELIDRLGIYIENKGGDLSIQEVLACYLRDELSEAEIRDDDVTAMATQVLPDSCDGKVWTIKHPSGKSKSFPLGDFNGVFDINPPAELENEQIAVHYSDGTVVHGQISDFSSGKLNLSSNCFVETGKFFVHTDVERAVFLSSQDTDQPEAKPMLSESVLISGETKLTGHLTANATDSSPSWKTSGTTNSVGIIAKDIHLVVKPDAKSLPQISNEASPNTVYLKNLDWVPCKVTHVDSEQVKFESQGKTFHISTEMVSGIGLGCESLQATFPKNDLNWQNLSGKDLAIQNGTIVLEPGSSIGQNELFATGEFQFELQHNGKTPDKLKCGFLVDQRDEDGQSVSMPVFEIHLSRNRFAVQSSAQNSEFSWTRHPNSTILVNIRRNDHSVQVHVNGNLRGSYPYKFEARNESGCGFSFSFDSDDGVEGAEQGQMVLSNFLRINSRTDPGRAVNSHRRQVALSIPRSSQNNPPTHLLISKYGDLLRGDLVSMDSNHVTLDVRGLKRKFTRSSISNLVWIRTASETGSSDSKDTQVLNVDGRVFTMSECKWSKTDDGMVITGQSDLFGNLEFSESDIKEVRTGSFRFASKKPYFKDWVAKFTPQPKIPGLQETLPNRQSSSQKPTKVGPFEFQLADGTKITSKDLKGKVVVLDFWASWCGPCVRALPTLTDVVESYPKEGVALFAINQGESIDTIRAFLSTREWMCPVGMDNNGKSNALSKLFDVQSLPLTVVLNQDGELVYRKTGYDPKIGFSELKQKIESLLNR